MKIIGNAKDLSTLDPALASFIRQISPWVDDEQYIKIMTIDLKTLALVPFDA